MGNDNVTCERCGTPGGRKLGHVAPDGWFFGSFTLAPDGEHDPGDFLIVHACSPECRDALWTKMDGHRWDTIERRVDVPAELRRSAAHHAARLREEAARIRTSTYPCGAQATEYAGTAMARILDDAADAIERDVETDIEVRMSEAGNGGAGAA